MEKHDNDLARAATQAPPEVPQPTPARCPHCQQSPASINATMITFPAQGAPLVAIMFACANPGCRRIFSVAPMGMLQQPQPAIVPAGAGLPRGLADKIRSGNLKKAN